MWISSERARLKHPAQTSPVYIIIISTFFLSRPSSRYSRPIPLISSHTSDTTSRDPWSVYLQRSLTDVVRCSTQGSRSPSCFSRCFLRYFFRTLTVNIPLLLPGCSIHLPSTSSSFRSAGTSSPFHGNGRSLTCTRGKVTFPRPV